MTFTSVVPHHLAKRSLLDYLVTRFTYHDVPAWSSLIHQERLLCNGVVGYPSTIIATGDIVSFIVPDYEEPDADLNYSIIYEDEWLCAVNKPANLLMHRAGKAIRNNLISLLRYDHTPPIPSANTVNRLDRDTSGIVLVAKDPVTLSAMNSALAQGKWCKEYTALVHGTPEERLWNIDLPIGQDTSVRLPCRFKIDHETGKPAKTIIINAVPLGRNHSILTLCPITGRTHQLRVHCAAIGHPIVGDPLYKGSATGPSVNISTSQIGVDPAVSSSEILINRQALHCSSVSFTHPHSKKNITVEAPLSGDIRQCCALLLQDNHA